jgi:hypothetical protein
MWFRLAKELGMSVRRCQQEISSAEFGEWIAFYSIEPFGDRYADLRAGVVASTVANVNRGKDTPPFSPLSLIPWAQEPKDDTPPPAEAVAAMFGVNLTEAKASGQKTFVIKRRASG